jgi:hypothetical protein
MLRAQELAEAGDPNYAWQINAFSTRVPRYNSEIIARFVREVLGWDAYTGRRWENIVYSSNDSGFAVIVVRCASFGTSPDDLYRKRADCAPTLDDGTYETVRIEGDRPVRQDSAGIWVVIAWEMVEPSTEVRVR